MFNLKVQMFTNKWNNKPAILTLTKAFPQAFKALIFIVYFCLWKQNQQNWFRQIEVLIKKYMNNTRVRIRSFPQTLLPQNKTNQYRKHLLVFPTAFAHFTIQIFQFYSKRLIHEWINDWIGGIVHKISVENHNIVWN